MLIQCRAEFTPRLCQVLLQGVCFEGQRIPFFLENAEKRRDGCEGGWSRADNALRLDIDQIIGGELFAVDRILAVLGNVRLNEALLEDTAYLDVRWALCARSR